MRVLNSLLALAAGLMLAACADKYDPNKEYGFVMSGGEDERAQVVENPPPNKARLYGVRDGIFAFLVRHNVTLHTLQQANEGFKDGFFFGRSKPNTAFFVDIVPSGEPIVVSAKTEARVNFAFTPKPDKIYCVAVGLGTGFFIARPYFTLMEKEKCLKVLPGLLKGDFMKEWQKDKEAYEKGIAAEKARAENAGSQEENKSPTNNETRISEPF